MPTLEKPIPAADQPKRLYRFVEPCYAALAGADDVALLSSALETTLDRFGEDCGIRAGVVAHWEGARWRAVSGSDPSLLSELMSLSPAERETLARDHIVFACGDAPALFWLLGARSEWLAVYRLARVPEEHVALLLQMCRLAVQHRLLENGWTGLLDRARAIQRSLLPEPLPRLADFDLAARSESAEAVGGDVYDAIPHPPDVLGLAIADASGHGLPAALEARDVVMGLRMGAAQHLKIASTIERLNRILCGSTLASRFVSLVYGELDADGGFHYVNAGHPPPLVLADNEAVPLPEAGRVLGVSPDSLYRVGHAFVPKGGTLLLYTDGVTECPSPRGEEFGVERLIRMSNALADAPASHLCAAIFDALFDHSGGASLPDDATVLIARRSPF